jgi:hypothetical protein
MEGGRPHVEGGRGRRVGRRSYLVGRDAAPRRALDGGAAARGHSGRPGHRISPTRGTKHGGQEGAGPELSGRGARRGGVVRGRDGRKEDERNESYVCNE